MKEQNLVALSEGAVFHGRYQIVRCVATGGMGAVYECIHLTTRKHRALKVMLPEIIAAPGMRERFELEARATADIESDHVVETFDAGVDEATRAPFLVMELLRGDDLETMLEVRGPFTPDEVVLLLSQAALALDKTHAAGIVHRDLKPQNLFLTTRDDGSPRLKILDFGIAKVVADGTKTTQTTMAIGTAVYMSPEQSTGNGGIGPPSDLFALGHIAYALLTGQPYWIEEQRSLPPYAFLTRMLAGATEPPSARALRHSVTLAPAFDAWFVRATAQAPEDRYDRASSQIAELAVALGTTSARPSIGEPAPLAPPAAALARPPTQREPGPTVSVTLAAAREQPPVAPRHRSTLGTRGALSKDQAPTPAASSRSPVVMLAAGGTIGLLVVVRAIAGSPGAPAAAVTATAASVQTSTVAPPAPTAVTVSAPTSPSATASSAAGVASSSPGPEPAPSASAAKGRAPAAARPIAAPWPVDGPRPAPARDCDPPYDVDGLGHRHMKPQCL